MRAMFTVVWRALEAGQTARVAARLEPALERPGPDGAERAFAECRRAIILLFQGALLEHGATPEDCFGGEPLLFSLGDERVATREIFVQLVTKSDAARATLTRWAERFEAARESE